MIDRSIKQGSKKQEINIHPVGRSVSQSGVTQSVIHVPDIDFEPLISNCIIVIAIFVKHVVCVYCSTKDVEFHACREGGRGGGWFKYPARFFRGVRNLNLGTFQNLNNWKRFPKIYIMSQTAFFASTVKLIPLGET